MPVNTVLNWSSGKDAALAYHYLSQHQQYKVTHLLTTINSEHERIFMHGVRKELLLAQAERMGLPVTALALPPSPDDTLYKDAMLQTLTTLKNSGISAAAYGDIFLEDLRTYREQQLAQIGIETVFPLWKRDTRELIQQIETSGIEAIIVCVSEKYLPKEFLGRKIDRAFLNDLPTGVDPCGEHGEFHTFVYNAPFFRSAIPITVDETVYKQYTPANDADNNWNTGFYFLDIHL